MPALTPDQIAASFQALYGAPPTHLARAPGRVNQIGEHIDYAGLPVLPMVRSSRTRRATGAIT